MRFNPASAARASGAPTSIMESSRISRRWPSRWRAVFRWARCFAPKRSRAPFSRACTEPRSAAGRWPARWPSPSSTRSKREDMLAHIQEWAATSSANLHDLARSTPPSSTCAGMGLMLALELDSADTGEVVVAARCSSGASLSTAPARPCCVFFRPSSWASSMWTLPLPHLTKFCTEHAPAQTRRCPTGGTQIGQQTLID